MAPSSSYCSKFCMGDGMGGGEGGGWGPVLLACCYAEVRASQRDICLGWETVHHRLPATLQPNSPACPARAPPPADTAAAAQRPSSSPAPQRRGGHAALMRRRGCEREEGDGV